MENANIFDICDDHREFIFIFFSENPIKFTGKASVVGRVVFWVTLLIIMLITKLGMRELESLYVSGNKIYLS